MAEAPTITLRDLAEAWHLCAAFGLTSPAAAHLADGSGALLATLALLAGHRRPAATLSATSCAAWLASALIHHGSPL
ncbi:hypothetical protein [Streptomyces sp. NPDC046909]|uniref:hypothetical protein n=1 Tax=Streptomyces sp. NPDC046909 TaxID=3155617 RepID=UPI0033CCD48B